MKTKSLIRRAVFSVFLAQLLCAAVLCAAALLHEHQTRFRAFDTRLQGKSDSLLGAVQDAEDPEDNVTIDPTELKLPGEDAYAVYNQGGRLLGTSSNAPSALISRGADGYRDVKHLGKRYRVFQREALRIIDRAEYGGVGLRRPVTIVYTAPVAHVWHEIFEAASYYLLTILLASAGVVLLVTALLRRAFLPLTELADATANLRAPALAFDPPQSALHVLELRPLTQVLEQTISRLRESFARERQFFGDAAHELKTAIAVVRSSAQLLLMKRRSELEYSEGVEGIVQDTERLETLVMQMLQLAHETEAGEAPLQIVNVGETVRSVASLLQPVANHRGLQIRVEAISDAPVRIKKQSAETLVSNLLLNAIQYSVEGGTVEVSVLKKGADSVCIQVTDHGLGIGAEALPHIFDRFYREDRSRARGTGGAGLGLAISKSIVDTAKGSIQVQSSKGEGTTMIVTFTAA